MQDKVSSFEDLLIWVEARELTRMIYELSKDWRDFSLRDQIRRASVSIVSNIAEGFERGTKDEFIHFLYMAKGSAGEVRAQNYLALDIRLIEKADFEKVSGQALKVSRYIANFIISYKDKGYKIK